MAAIKDAAMIAEKYSTVTPTRQSFYEAGVRNPTKDWGAQTAAAEPNYEAGVQAAISNKQFGKGVRKAGTARWQSQATTVGPGRWGAGVRAAGPAYQSGFEPYRGTISSLTLPPRYPAGDPRNIDRVSQIAQALHAKKLSG